MARKNDSFFVPRPAFVGHEPYLRSLTEDVELADVDAIFVSTIDEGERLISAAELAAKTDCPLVVMASGNATPESVAERLAHIEGLSLAVVTIPPGYEHPTLNLASDDHPFGTIRSVGDLSYKRNLVTCIGRMMGLRSVLLLDDDMSGATPELIRRAAGHLKSGFDAVGFAGAGFPDNSSVEHAASLTSRESLFGQVRGGRANLAVSGNSLLIDPMRFEEPFLTFYNEDWLAVLSALLQGKVGVLGHMVQRPYEPFDGKRPTSQEAGEILTEGLFDLARAEKGLGDSTIAFWENRLAERRIRLTQIYQKLRILRPDRTAVVDLEALDDLEANDVEDPAYQWLRDKRDKLRRYVLAREDSPEGSELRRKALETLELALEAHANITAHDLHSAALLWREDQKRYAARLAELPEASWQQAMDYFGLEAVWPFTNGPTGTLAKPEPWAPSTAPRLPPRAKRANPNNDFVVDLPDGHHRIYGRRRGNPSLSNAAVLFVHDLGKDPNEAPTRTWANQLRLNRKDLLVLTPNLYHEEKNLARSARDCTLATSVSDLEYLIANLPELNADLPLVVVGSGVGGLIATALPPDRIDGLVLVNPNHPEDGLFNQENPQLSTSDDFRYLRMKIGVGGLEVPAELRKEYRNWPLREHFDAITVAGTSVRILSSRDNQRFAKKFEQLSLGSRLSISYGPDHGNSLARTRAVVDVIERAADDALGAPRILPPDRAFYAAGRFTHRRTATRQRRTPPARPAPHRK